MRNVYTSLKFIISIIAVLVFLAGIVLVSLGVYDFIKALGRFGTADKEHIAGSVAIGLLSAIDMFLISVVCFVFSLGLLIIFDEKHSLIPRLPEWLQLKSFIELKLILWEAVLTTLVVGFLTNLVSKKIEHEIIDQTVLIIPIGILLIAVSLFFLKKGEGDAH
jgi:uncharacterized membrane protein YqhA